MKKLVLFVLLITVLPLASCGLFNQENKTEDKKPQEVTQEENGGEEEIILEEGTGIYIGQVDNNSVEINVDDQPLVFVITEVKDKIDQLEENEEVAVEYFENEYGQLILQKIEKVK